MKLVTKYTPRENEQVCLLCGTSINLLRDPHRMMFDYHRYDLIGNSYPGGPENMVRFVAWRVYCSSCGKNAPGGQTTSEHVSQAHYDALVAERKDHAVMILWDDDDYEREMDAINCVLMCACCKHSRKDHAWQDSPKLRPHACNVHGCDCKDYNPQGTPESLTARLNGEPSLRCDHCASLITAERQAGVFEVICIVCAGEKQ